ncbi:thiolase family protein [Kribbia dieselivorans]|uniref:thiolase family protein n=1 Tax=Kribbia dieselivorans TaxID=331526 RepID=UPI0008393DDB|nr:thiolase family protein [Kribbia dieselivorans]
MTREAVIVDAVRTPVGKRGGRLSGWHPTDLLAHTLTELVTRTGVDPARIADVIAGCALPRGEQSGNIARSALLGAGLPEAIPGTSVDRACGSGQQSVHFAAQAVRSGEYDFAIGAGVESMSRVDLGPLFNPGGGMGDWYGERLLARYDGNLPAQGPSAELVAAKYGLTREQLDAFSVTSHERAFAATEAGYFASQLVAIDGLAADGTTTPGMARDEGIRTTVDPEKLAGLRPVFADDGVITAGNASQMSDGAAALLVAERSAAEAAGMRPRARIVSMAVAGDDPRLQFTAVVPATRKVLDQAGLTIGDIDLVEVNEAFAPVPLLWQAELGYPADQLNVNGGAIAIGHALGSTGGRLLTQLVNELERREARYGLLTICEAAGMANATIIERLA